MKKIYTLLMMLMLVLSTTAAVLTPSTTIPLKGIDGPSLRSVGLSKKAYIAAMQAASGKQSIQQQSFKYHKPVVQNASAGIGHAAQSANRAYTIEDGISITVDNIQPTTAHFTLVPDNLDEFYFFAVLEAASYNTMTAEEVYEYCKSDIENQIAIYDEFGLPANYATFCFTGRSISGTYTELEPNTEYVVVAFYIEGETGEQLSALYTANFTTTEEETQPITQYETIHIVDPEWVDEVEEQGWWQIRGYTEDENYYVTLSNLYSDVVAGQYSTDDMDKDFTFLAIGDQQVFFTDITTTITIEGSILTVKAEADAKNGVHYTITFDTIDLSKPRGNKYDFTDEDIVADFTTAETTIEISEEEGYAYISCERDGEALVMLLYIDGAELTAGTYEVADTYEPGTVQPCQIGPNGVYPSFWAYTMEDSSLLVPFFFFANGTVEVSYDAAGDLVLTADVTNTWLRSGKFTINAQTDAIQHIDGAKAGTIAKTIENGHIVIRKNGQRYNVMGIQY